MLSLIRRTAIILVEYSKRRVICHEEIKCPEDSNS